MKVVVVGIMFLAITSLSCAAASSKCSKAAIKGALEHFKSENPQIVEIAHLDQDDNIVDYETGLFGVTVSVNQSCYDGVKVKTELYSTPKKRIKCRVISLSQYANRDCG